MTEPPPDDHNETLEFLVFDTLERMEKEGTVAIESAVSDHPELEQELRERLGTLQAMGLIGTEGDAPIAVPASLGSYEIGKRIGEGGMGLVFLARDTALDRDIALKLIRPELIASSSLRERFTRESLAVARLQHPAVGRIFDAGEIAGFPFIAMEYIQGCTLSQALDALDGQPPEGLTGHDMRVCVEELSNMGPLELRGAPKQPTAESSPSTVLFEGTWGETCMRIGLAVAEGLACAHAAGVLHRDIKASNVMITPGGRVVLIDFGLAQLDSAAQLTTTGGRVGSLPYLAPERIVHAVPAAQSADLYGLGVLLYELLTLRLPFRAGSESALVKLIARSQPEPLRSINPAVSPLIRDVTERAMRPDPARRPPSAADYAVDLSRVLAGKPPLPHGDGPIAALRSRWRSQPVVTAALALSAALLLLLPAAVLSVKVKAAERSARSNELSVARLALALRAANDLQSSLPITDVVEGTPVGELRAYVLQSLVQLRSAILSDPHFETSSETLEAEATRVHREALLRIGQEQEAPDRTSPETVARGIEAAERLMQSVRDGTAASGDRAAIMAAHHILPVLPLDPASEAVGREAAEVLRIMLSGTSHLIDAKAMLAQLLHGLSTFNASRGETDEARARLAEALALLQELKLALPESKRLVSLEKEWSPLLDSLSVQVESAGSPHPGDKR